MKRLGISQWKALQTIAWGTEHFGATVTGRQTPRRVVLSLVARGYAKSAGLVAVCDGDGFLVQPERWREGWTITAAGKKTLSEEAS